MTDAPKLTARHVEVMRHTLGADSRTPGYRNHFNPGGDDVRLCEELATLGLMIATATPAFVEGGMYCATALGKQLVLRPRDIKRMERP